MNQELIGSNAGLIWNALTTLDKQTLKALKKSTKLKDKDLYCALGWLSREGKVAFDETGEEIVVCLN